MTDLYREFTSPGGIDDIVQRAVDQVCTCGGRGPDDDPCPACEVWHEYVDLRAERYGIPHKHRRGAKVPDTWKIE